MHNEACMPASPVRSPYGIVLSAPQSAASLPQQRVTRTMLPTNKPALLRVQSLTTFSCAPQGLPAAGEACDPHGGARVRQAEQRQF